MARLPQAFIDQVLDRTDIVDVVDRRVKLKKAGKNYSACCPFHQEKTPSFSVNPDKQFYYCFGCGAGGNALGFIMECERMDFREAIELLAHSAGIEMPPEEADNAPQVDNQKPLYELGIVSETGIIGDLAAFFQSISTNYTYPIFTFISAGMVNFFVPSGGGQWYVQGPLIIQSAIEMEIPLNKSIMAMAYGDQLTNMMQPFWALPLLG